MESFRVFLLHAHVYGVEMEVIRLPDQGNVARRVQVCIFTFLSFLLFLIHSSSRGLWYIFQFSKWNQHIQRIKYRWRHGRVVNVSCFHEQT